MGDSIDLPAVCALKAASSYTTTTLQDAVKLRLGKHGLAASPPQTVPEVFRACCIQSSANLDKSALLSNATLAAWESINYAEYLQQAQQSALLLMHVGLQPRTSVGILAHNCPECFYAEIGTLLAGGIVAGIYLNNSTEAVYHVLATASATVCVVGDAAQMAKVRAVRSRLPLLRAVVQLQGPYDEFVDSEEGYYRWEKLFAMQFPEALSVEQERRERDVAANECALLIYTSGTVGMPKGVMISHDGLIYNNKAMTAMSTRLEQGVERGLTYLPLSHVAAQALDIFFSIMNGVCTYFADRNALRGTLNKTMVHVKPTFMFGVPRIFEKIQEKIRLMESKSTPFAKYVMDKAREVVGRYHLDLSEGKPASTFKYWLASKVTQQVKIALGLEHCKYMFIGGAPSSVELKHFFLSLDIVLRDLYGLSEASGTVNMQADLSNLGSVGKALPGLEVEIFEPDAEGQGEICLRGRTAFMGYVNEVEKTYDTIKEDGWLHTGDMGYIDTLGNLVVSGRIKELVITAGGENIPPVHIEGLLKRELPAVSHALLVGDRRKYLTVLLTLKTNFDDNTGVPLDALQPDVVAWLKTLGLNYTRLSEVLGIKHNVNPLADSKPLEVHPHPEVVHAIEMGIKRANTFAISHAQRVQKFALLPHDFSQPTGELGNTLKVRRNIVIQKYADVIDRLYK